MNKTSISNPNDYPVKNKILDFLLGFFVIFGIKLILNRAMISLSTEFWVNKSFSIGSLIDSSSYWDLFTVYYLNCYSFPFECIFVRTVSGIMIGSQIIGITFFWKRRRYLSFGLIFEIIIAILSSGMIFLIFPRD